MTDLIIGAIEAKSLHRHNIHFGEIRRIAGRDQGLHDELDYGRRILHSEDLLDQYLHSYGMMTLYQWKIFLRKVTSPIGSVRIVDYGCGQGLGTALLFDQFGLEFLGRTDSVILIEPSAVALARAEAIVNCYSESIVLIAHKSKVESLAPNFLPADPAKRTVHVLSNVLDLSHFDHVALLGKILQNQGRHTILAVSHDRDHNGGSSRFDSASAFLEQSRQRGECLIGDSKIERFTCQNKMPAISWQVHLEV